MSSTCSTVRSAVLNGVFSGTRSMPKLMSVIFMACSSFVFRHPDNVGDAVDVVVVLAEPQRDQRRQRYPVEVHGMQFAVGAEVAAAVGVVDHVGHAVDAADEHHHVAGDVDQVAGV